MVIKSSSRSQENMLKIYFRFVLVVCIAVFNAQPIQLPVLLAGKENAGKSALANCWAHNSDLSRLKQVKTSERALTFTKRQRKSVSKSHFLEHDLDLDLVLFDTSGAKGDTQLVLNAAPHAKVILLVFAANDIQGLKKDVLLRKQKLSYVSDAGVQGPWWGPQHDVHWILVETKIDMNEFPLVTEAAERNDVLFDASKGYENAADGLRAHRRIIGEWAKQNGFFCFLQVTSKDISAVNHVFKTAFDAAFSHHVRYNSARNLLTYLLTQLQVPHLDEADLKTSEFLTSVEDNRFSFRRPFLRKEEVLLSVPFATKVLKQKIESEGGAIPESFAESLREAIDRVFAGAQRGPLGPVAFPANFLSEWQSGGQQQAIQQQFIVFRTFGISKALALEGIDLAVAMFRNFESGDGDLSNSRSSLISSLRRKSSEAKPSQLPADFRAVCEGIVQNVYGA